MNHLVNITKKELRELLTPGSLVSIFFIVILFVALGQGMSGQTEKAAAPAVIGIQYEGGEAQAGEYVYGTTLTYKDLVEGAYIALYGDDADLENINIITPETAPYGDSGAVCKAVADNGYKYAISLPSDIGSRISASQPTVLPVYYVYKDGGVFSTVSAASANSYIELMSELLSLEILKIDYGITETAAIAAEHPLLTGGNSTHTLVNGKVYDSITPSEIYNAQMSQSMMVPIVVMIVISMVGSVIITSMGSEKENKTLETLLTMPVRRTTIVSGKLLAAAIMGLIYGIFYLIGMMFYTNGITSGVSSSVNLDDYGLGMTMVNWCILFGILFLSIFSALGICMILGAFTKNYKMAQTMVMPITVMAIIPMLVLMFSDWNSLPPALQAIMFAIPFSHPMMAMHNLVLENTALILGGVAYLAILDIVLVCITVRLYNSDVLITGLDKTKIMKRFGLSGKSKGRRQ